MSGQEPRRLAADRACSSSEINSVAEPSLRSLRRSIKCGGLISRLLPQIVPGLPDMGSGYFRIISDQPVFSFPVFGTNALSVLSAVPAQTAPGP